MIINCRYQQAVISTEPIDDFYFAIYAESPLCPKRRVDPHDKGTEQEAVERATYFAELCDFAYEQGYRMFNGEFRNKDRVEVGFTDALDYGRSKFTK